MNGSVVKLEEIFSGIATNWKYFVNNIRIDTTHVETQTKFQQNISGKKSKSTYNQFQTMTPAGPNGSKFVLGGREVKVLHSIWFITADAK